MSIYVYTIGEGTSLHRQFMLNTSFIFTNWIFVRERESKSHN